MKIRYEPSLDGLRAVAILSVMAFHFTLRRGWAPSGLYGVDVFFVLSGFLITSILLREVETTGAIDYPGFLSRRVRRLAPAFVLLLAVYLAAAPYVYEPRIAHRAWFDVLTAGFYITDLRQAFLPSNDIPLDHTWSLAIEEQFYLLWPFAVLALARLSRRTAAMVLCGTWIVLTAAQAGWQIAFPRSDFSYFFPPFHASGLIIGAALAFAPRHIPAGRFGLIVLAALPFLPRDRMIGRSIAELATIAVIVGRPRLLTLAPLRFLGRISYGVYLWHIPLLWAIGAGDVLHLIYTAIGSIAAGWLSYVLIEQWFIRRSRPVALGPANHVRA